MHPFRRVLQTLGFDVHRYHKASRPFAQFTGLGIQTIIDVGANVGQFAKEIRTLLPDAEIHSFEPLPDCYEKLRKSMAGDPKFSAYPFALGDTSSNTTINRSDYSLSSSLRPMAEAHKKLFPHTAGQTTEEIRVERLDDALAGKELASRILLKIDAQGYEDKVLAGGSSTLSKSDVALLEASFVELYEGQPLFEDIYALMHDAGFVYRGALQQKIDAKTGKVLFEDALFLRKNTVELSTK